MSIATYQATARGRLRHRFWGEYSAAIVLVFDDGTDACAALPILGAGWKPTDEAHVLFWVGDSAALKACIDVLAAFGADRKAVDSIAHSIDYGDPFTVAIPLPIRGQDSLPGVAP